MKKHFIYLSILIMLTYQSVAFAQRFDPSRLPKIGIVTGTVIDSTTGDPVAYASVSLISEKEQTVVTGGITDDQGHFRINEIQLGRYDLAVDFIGYEKTIIAGINLFPGDGGGIEQNLGTIQLVMTSLQMEQLDVYAESPQWVQTIDKQIFFVDRSLTIKGGTASDALKKIPNVDVDIDGNISLRGDLNVTVLLDGKPSGMTHGDRRAMVDNIPAAMIDKVEVITNPSAKYDPDGMGGIINIILKRGIFEGFNGSSSLSAGEYGKYNASGMVNYRVDNWNLTASGSYSKGNRYGKGERLFEYYYDSEPDSSIEQKTLRNSIPKNISFRLGGDYYLGKKNTFSLTTTFGNHNNRNENSIEYIQPAIGEIISIDWDKGTSIDYTFRYDRDFDRQEQDLIVDLSYNTSMDEQIEEQLEQGEEISEEHHHEEDGAHSHADEYNSNLIFSTDYTHPFGEKTVLEAGFKSTLKSFNSDLEYLLLPYSYKYNEDVHAAYFTMSYKLTDRLGFKIGARAEQVNTNAEVSKESATENDSTNVFTAVIDNAIDESPFDNPYFQIYPSLFLLYDFTQSSQIQFGYSKRVNRPHRRTLSPFPRNTSDVNHIRNGNPFLQPEYIDALEFNYFTNTRLLTFNTGLAFKKVMNMIQWWDRDMIVVDGKEYELLTADNAGHADQYTGHLMLNLRPLPLINLTLNVYGWKSTTYTSEEPDLNGESQGYAGFGNLNLNIPGIVRLELSSRFRGKMLITYGHIPASASLDLGLEKSFLNRRLSVVLKVNDVLNNAKFSIYTEQEMESLISNETYLQTMDAWRKRDRRTVSLALTYNFGNLEQKRKWDRSKMRGGDGGGMMDMDY